jgi:hypothetical protein
VLEGRHAVSALKDLHLDLTRPTPHTDAAQIRRPIAANACDTVATLAAFGVKYHRTPMKRIFTRRVGTGAICKGESKDAAGDDGNTGAFSAAGRAGHVQSILSKVQEELHLERSPEADASPRDKHPRKPSSCALFL